MYRKMVTKIANISIQGDRVLRYLCNTNKSVSYEIIGFQHKCIKLIDYRRKGVEAFIRLDQEENIREFLQEFNTSAKVTINQDETGKDILIELFDFQDDYPTHYLWIVFGLRDSVPVYNYTYRTIAPLEGGSYAFVALFELSTESEVVACEAAALECR